MQTPEHYKHGKIQPIDVIYDWNLNFSLGCVLKYVARHKHKNNPVSDLKKARDYLDIEIDRLERESNPVEFDGIK